MVGLGVTRHIASRASVLVARGRCQAARAGSASLSSYTAAADPRRSPFLRALPASTHARIPTAMLKFHVSGGTCRGPMVVERGRSAVAQLLATLGQLPPATPPQRAHAPEDVVVTSAPDPRGAPGGGGVAWARTFPGMGGAALCSRWYFDEGSGLAVDSFTWRGVRDFASFGFELVPVEVDHGGGSGAASSSLTFDRLPSARLVGFRHVTKAAWVLGLRLPPWLAMSADGVSLPHADGRGWDVEVEVTHPWVGRVVSYRGFVRVDDPALGTGAPAPSAETRHQPQPRP